MSEAEQIQTDIITTPPGTRELKPEREGLCETHPEGNSAFTLLSGLFKASQVASGPWRACLALWDVGMATLWPNFSVRP